MTSLDGPELAQASVPGLSDEETVGFIPSQAVVKPAWGGRVRAAALGLAALAGVAVATVYFRPSAACDAPARAASQGTELGAVIGLAERRRHADEKAKAVVQVLNEKPKEEINGLVQKAMQHAGEVALAKRRRKVQDQAGFNALLIAQSNVCTLEDPTPGPKDGIFVSHDGGHRILRSQYESGPTQWRITQRPNDRYRIHAIVPTSKGEDLVRDGAGDVVLGDLTDAYEWRIKPAAGGANPNGLFTVRSVGAPAGAAFLARKGKTGVFLSTNGLAAKWQIKCGPAEYSREAQRKATCAFNVLYATQYIARASLLIQAAARTCPNSKGLLNKICQVNGIITVAALSNLALSLSNAASSCAETTSVKALCASAVEALIVSLTTIGAGGIVTATACQPGLQAADLQLPAGATPANLGGPVYLSGRRLFLGGGKGNFIGQCILDFTQVAWSLGSVGIAITAAVRDACPGSIQGTGILIGLSQAACSMDIAAVIYAFSRIALFLALATIHCTDALNIQALCSGGITALIAAAAALVVTGDAFYIACDQGIKVVNSGGTVPAQLGAAAEAGATRRLAAKALADGAANTDVHKMVKDLGYNTSSPLRQPTFESVESAMRVLEAYDEREAEHFGVGEASLRKRFKGVEDMWAHVGFNMSDPEVIPAAPARGDESERFLKVIEPVLSEQDTADVAAAMAPRPLQKWERLLGGGKRCA